MQWKSISATKETHALVNHYDIKVIFMESRNYDIKRQNYDTKSSVEQITERDNYEIKARAKISTFVIIMT